MKSSFLLLFGIMAVFTFCMSTAENKGSETLAEETLPPSELTDWAKNIQAQPEMKAASIGLYVVDLQSGSQVAAWDENRGLATASTMKAVTTATALQVLGKDYRFETTIEYDGQLLADGTLQGNLFIRGGGDPTFGSDNMESLLLFLANRVKEKGVKKITGKIVADASIFEDALTPRTWSWEDMGNYYGAGASGLSVGENAYRLFFRTGSAVGQPTQLLRTDPQIPNLKIENQVVTGTKADGDNAYVFGVEYTFDRVVRGTLPPNQSEFIIKGSVPDPAFLCAHYFAAAIKKAGILGELIPTTHRLTNLPKNPRITLHQYYSEPLSKIIETTNLKSMNLYAEAMTKMIGVKLKGKGTTEAGTEAMTDFWKGKGVDMEGAFLEDGSGLSRFNSLSAKQMTQIVRLAFLADTASAYRNSLPIAGQTGTLRNMAKGTAAEGRIIAKSGYINRVRSYTGLVETASGKKLVFAILINNYAKEGSDLSKDFVSLFEKMARQ